MNDTNTIDTIMRRLFKQAQNNHGIKLDPSQVREIAGQVFNMDNALKQLHAALERYVTAYGADLLRDTIVEGEIVEAERSEDGAAGVHSSEESGGPLDVPAVLGGIDDEEDTNQNGPYVL